MSTRAIVLLIVGLLLLVALGNRLLGPNPAALRATEEAEEAPDRPTAAQIVAVRSEMKEWAEGRWSGYTAHWDEDGQKVVMEVVADAGANETAVRGYCQIMREIAGELLAGWDWVASVERSGERIEC